jgi:Fic family protein
MLTQTEKLVLDFVGNHPQSSSMDVHEGANLACSYATTKRTLTKLSDKKFLVVLGIGKGTRYSLSPVYNLLVPINLETYYQREIDEREIFSGYKSELINETLKDNDVFTLEELQNLVELQAQFKNNINQLSESEYKQELERLAIDLSWKSSQIEGNTYSLLETERLLRERETAAGKSKDEAVMLLNHKEALDFIIDQSDYISPITVSKIEDIHSILIKELNIERNLRKSRVGISGTNYKPLDNEFLISEALNDMCALINKKQNVFEKALLTLLLISYIQPFVDGNKRTARIVSNAILIQYGFCPISFRTIDSIEYKKAMLLFYEQNNISAFKKIFIDQFEFAVKTYF